jgi:hypothetical protein
MTTLHRHIPPTHAAQFSGLATEITIKLTPFDQKEYRKLIEARGETLRRVVTKLKPALGFSNALDAGCGVGFFRNCLPSAGSMLAGSMDERKT